MATTTARTLSFAALLGLGRRSLSRRSLRHRRDDVLYLFRRALARFAFRTRFPLRSRHTFCPWFAGFTRLARLTCLASLALRTPLDLDATSFDNRAAVFIALTGSALLTTVALLALAHGFNAVRPLGAFAAVATALAIAIATLTALLARAAFHLLGRRCDSFCLLAAPEKIGITDCP